MHLCLMVEAQSERREIFCNVMLLKPSEDVFQHGCISVVPVTLSVKVLDGSSVKPAEIGELLALYFAEPEPRL